MSVNNDYDVSLRDEEVNIIPSVASHLQEIDGNLANYGNDGDELLSYTSTESFSSRGTSWYSAVFLVVNAALGAGLLDFPLAFSQAGGVLVAVLVQIVLVIFAILALVILAYCSKCHFSKTYQDVVASVCGKRAQRICSMIIVLYCYGTCITFIIIIGDQFDRIFASLYGSDFCHIWFMNRKLTTTITCIILILPLCFPKKIDFLKYASGFGVFSVMYVEFVIIYKYYENSHEESGTIKTKPDHWTDVFLVVPVICFGYQCHVSCVPVYACLQDRRVSNFLKTVTVAILICAFTYTVAATYGYLTFGSHIQSDILYMYDAKDNVVLVGILALALKTVTTYPILQFCGRAAIDDLYVQYKRMSIPQSKLHERQRRIIIALVWFFSSLAFSLLIPNIGDVIEYLGSLAAIFIFIFPGLCLMKETLKTDPYFLTKSSKYSVVFGALFMAIGAFIFGQVITQSIYDDVSPSKDAVIKLCT